MSEFIRFGGEDYKIDVYTIHQCVLNHYNVVVVEQFYRVVCHYKTVKVEAECSTVEDCILVINDKIRGVLK